MKSFVLFLAMIVMSCGSSQELFKNKLPPGSVIIKVYDNNWVKWKFEGECFLSSWYRDFSTTKVDCKK